MPGDLKLIKQLEKEIGHDLKVGKDTSGKDYEGLYERDVKGDVIRLYLRRFQLKEFPRTILKLKNLTYLSFYGNQLSKLPSEIKNLQNLTYLNLHFNQLSTLPPEIKHLTNLKTLGLNHNQLTKLPPEITELKNLKGLHLYGNPLKKPSPEIADAEDNIEKIRNYFADLETQGEDYIYEAKLILVGAPGAGKTSLAKKLMNPKYPLSTEEKMTKGIDVEKWQFPYSKEISFQCNIWDFGGQDIMHATHRYFLTKRSLYVVVADNRKEDIDFYYWLNILELLSGKSPVLIVLNEKFDYKKSVPEDIVKAFESVKKVFNINLATNTGLSDLSKAIQKYICDLPHVGKDPIPKKWVSIRKSLEADKRNFITLNDYLEICKKNGVDDEEKATYISEFLHDLGVILHFQKDRILRNTVILNTRWATEAVYQVLFDNTVIKKGGEFDNSDLGRIWKQAHYKDKHAELLQLMLNFELCYEIGNSQKYIIPDLLPDKSSADKTFWAKQKKLLHFEYRYDFMPKGLISRLIVRMNKYIHKKQQWKNGVVLKNGDSLAEIVETFDKRVLKIRLAGKDRLEALAVIRKEVRDLHDTFENLVVFEMVPCNCKECQKKKVPHFFNYDELKQYKQEGIKHIKCRIGKIKDVSVLALISDVIIKEDYEMKGEREDKIHVEVEVNPNIYVEGAKAGAKAHAQADVDIKITNEIKININGLSGTFDNLKEDLIDAAEDEETKGAIEKDVSKVEKALDNIQQAKTKDDIKPGTLSRVEKFIKKLNDTNTTVGKVFKKVEDGVGLAQDIAKNYNKIAQWLALPQVPELFLGKQDK